MKDRNQDIEANYYVNGLYEEILKRLEEQGIDPKTVSRTDLSAVDEFHVRGAAVSNELVEGYELGGLRVLDVGCGLGGPARMLADRFDCRVTGIDLSHEYVRTAHALSKLVKLEDQTKFIQGDALNLPFDDESFDVVWTQHVQMNVQDKQRFYEEINRVLARGGFFMYYDIFSGLAEPVIFPVPWASDESISFLAVPDVMHEYLKGMGLKPLQEVDQTDKGIEFFNNLFEKVAKQGPPTLGLNMLLGPEGLIKLDNVRQNLVKKRIILQSGVYKK